MAKISYLTSKERIALRLISEWLGESFFNRTWEEYWTIAQRIPKLEACYEYVNQRLAKMAATKFEPYEICYFRKGDRYIRYEHFPTSLSRETIRNALSKSASRSSRKIRK